MDNNSSRNPSNGGGIVLKNNERRIRFENPFALKVGQVFTGFGIGCGIGIGVGRPLNLGAIPVLNEVMSSARGATQAFSGVTRHVNGSFRRLGVKNVEAGVGCGVGFGHGFGVGLALKPSALLQFQLCVAQAVSKMMVKFGIAPESPLGQGALLSSLQGSISTMNNPLATDPAGRSITQLATKLPDQGYDDKPFSSRTEKVLSSFLQNPVLKGEGSEADRRLKSENDMLHMVLKHQKVIEELKEENEVLRQILVEELKVPPSKLQTTTGFKSRNMSPCSYCFECRRKQRKR